MYESGQQHHEIALKSQKDVGKVKDILAEILTLFADAEQVSDRYKLKTKSTSTETPYNPSTDLSFELFTLHNKMRDLAIKRQKGTSIMKKAAWALYDEKQFNRLIEDVTQLVDDLVDLFPAAERQQQLCRIEMDTLGKESDLEPLKDAARGVDDLFQKNVEKAIETREGHRYSNIQATDEAKMMIGDFVAAGSIPTGPGHIYNSITASGNSTVHSGNIYGGKSILTIEVSRCRGDTVVHRTGKSNIIF
jgi:hypothetical protein